MLNNSLKRMILLCVCVTMGVFAHGKKSSLRSDVQEHRTREHACQVKSDSGLGKSRFERMCGVTSGLTAMGAGGTIATVLFVAGLTSAIDGSSSEEAQAVGAKMMIVGPIIGCAIVAAGGMSTFYNIFR